MRVVPKLISKNAMCKSDAANMLIKYSNKMIDAVYCVCLGILYLLMATNCQENSLTTKMNLTTTMYVIIKSVVLS